jgi:two-component system, response regulator RegA
MLTENVSTDTDAAVRAFPDRSCLVVDDDLPFRQRLAGALTRKGFIVSVEATARDGIEIARANPPAFAVVDLRLGYDSGLDVLEALHTNRPDARSILLTGYGALSMAVSALRYGAKDVLTKPADIEDIINALIADPSGMPEAPNSAISPDRVRWEHIQSVFEKCDGNVSATARQLGMHRRTLQRILQKNPPR